MLLRLVIALIFAFALGCGSSEPAAQDEVTLTAPAARAELTDSAVVTKAAPIKKAVPPGDVLAKTADLDSGDLVIVFMNNVDGEIEPCG